MKVAGYWEYNYDMLVGLQMWDYYQIQLPKSGNNQKIAMTFAMVKVLETQYPNEQEELKLVIQKAKRFLKI